MNAGRAADQHGERGDVLAQRLVERRDRRALARHQRFLLGDFERGGGAGLEALLDQREHAVAAAMFWRAIRIRSCDDSTRK